MMSRRATPTGHRLAVQPGRRSPHRGKELAQHECAQRARVDVALGAERTSACGGTAKSLGGPLNLSQLCSPRLDRQAASAAQAADGPAAETAWAAATKRLTDLAPAVPLDGRESSYLTSARVGNRQQSPGLGVLLERAWVR
jgi:hypothetical protein